MGKLWILISLSSGWGKKTYLPFYPELGQCLGSRVHSSSHLHLEPELSVNMTASLPRTLGTETNTNSGPRPATQSCSGMLTTGWKIPCRLLPGKSSQVLCSARHSTQVTGLALDSLHRNKAGHRSSRLLRATVHTAGAKPC